MRPVEMEVMASFNLKIIVCQKCVGKSVHVLF